MEIDRADVLSEAQVSTDGLLSNKYIGTYGNYISWKTETTRCFPTNVGIKVRRVLPGRQGYCKHVTLKPSPAAGA